MPATAHDDARDTSRRGPSLRVRYALVIVVEAIVIASLYWIGRHFA